MNADSLAAPFAGSPVARPLRTALVRARPLQVAFFGPDAQSSTNSFGYSPHPLEQYLAWLRPLALTASTAVAGGSPAKLLIVSITGTLEETEQMLVRLQGFAGEIGQRIAVEFNASCPNIRGQLSRLFSTAPPQR